MVVAHPDDETLWGGGLLARYGPRITVICCSTPARDAIRATNFLRACEVYGAKGIVLEPTDEAADKPLRGLYLDLKDYDAIVTHNQWGEYGHAHHRQVHQHVKALAKAPVWCFGDERAVHDFGFKLTATEEATRLRALQCYDHVLPYGGRDMPKWQALLERYGNLQPVEFYHALKP